jgi:hypothetical protein
MKKQFDVLVDGSPGVRDTEQREQFGQRKLTELPIAGVPELVEFGSRVSPLLVRLTELVLAAIAITLFAGHAVGGYEHLHLPGYAIGVMFPIMVIPNLTWTHWSIRKRELIVETSGFWGRTIDAVKVDEIAGTVLDEDRDSDGDPTYEIVVTVRSGVKHRFSCRTKAKAQRMLDDVRTSLGLSEYLRLVTQGRIRP